MSSSLSRIEQKFVFNFLKQNKIFLEVKLDDKGTEAKIVDFTNKEVKLELKEVLEEFKSYKPDIKVFFYFQNNYHVFSSTIIKLQNNSAVIKNPESVVKKLLRKYERVLIEGSFNAVLELEGEVKELDYPQCNNTYYNPDKPPVKADFTNINIKEILARFKRKVAQSVSYNKIVMLRNYKAKSFFEAITLEYGKILFVPKSTSDIVIKDSEFELDFLKKDDWIDYEIKLNDTNPTFVNKEISTRLLELKRSFIYSKAIIPVLYRNYVVALIHLVNNLDKSASIDMSVINYAFQFSRILSYSLKINGYFKSELGAPDRRDASVYDISPGGLAIYVENDSLEDKLLLDHNVRVVINLEGRPIRVLAKVVRKFNRLSKHFYGLMFLEIKKDDYYFIKDNLYDDKVDVK